MSNETTQFHLCSECATAVVNDDYSAHDYNELSEDERNAQFSSVEAMGNVCHVGTDETVQGYFQCWVCSHDSLSAELFEAV